MIEAARLNACHAVLLVHSFSQTEQWFGDFRAFAGLFGVQAAAGQLVRLTQRREITVYAGWVRGDPLYLTE